MYRNLTHRIFGGVCSGLEDLTRLSAWVWRIIFVVLTLATSGGGLALYVALWWLSPAALGDHMRDKRPLNIVFVVLLVLLTMGAWFGRASLVSPIGEALYPHTLLLMLALIFLLRQVFARRERTSLIVALVALAVVFVLILGAWGTIPEGVYDLLLRSAPALLVFVGISIFLRDRLSFGGIVAVLVSVGLVAGLAVSAFSSRATQQRDDNQVMVEEAISDDITLLQVNVETLATEVEFLNSISDEYEVVASFVGSNASDIQVEYAEEESGLATFTLREVQTDSLPSLEDVGRGTLRLELPTDLAVSISFAAADGDVTLNLADLDLERLDMEIENGDALVTLPEYQPLSPTVQEDPGSLVLLGGNLTLILPENVGGEFLLSQEANNRPQFDDLLYALEDNVTDWRLVARGFDSFDTRIRYLLTVPRGSIRLEVE